MSKPRILFFGYSEVGYECLSLLLERGDHVCALITHEDNPHEKIWFKTPAVAAREKKIPDQLRLLQGHPCRRGP